MNRKERRRRDKTRRHDTTQPPEHLLAFEAAGNLFNAGNFEEARRVFEEILVSVPDSFEANLGIGMVHGIEGDVSAAIHFFEKAGDIQPASAEVFYNLGLALSQLGKVEQAVAAYRRSLKNSPSYEAWLNLGNLYDDSGDLDAAAGSYSKAIDLNPNHALAHVNLGNVQAKSGNREHAIRSYEAALEIDPDNEQARTQLHLNRARTIKGWHLSMLADTNRNDAYNKAITRAVKKTNGAHVLDIGTGSGLLAMMAARAGAEMVTACEIVGPLADAARQIVMDNGFAEKITVIGKSSENLVVGKDMARGADIIVSEILNVSLLGEGVLKTLSHAARALAAPDAIFIPSSARIFAVLVEAPALRRVNPLSKIAEFDLSSFNIFRNPGYQKIFLAHEEHRILSQPFPVIEFDFLTLRPRPPNHFDTFELEAEITSDGAAQAVVFWFELRLDEDTVISTSMTNRTTHWGQAIQFLDADIPVRQNDRQVVMVRLGFQEISFSLP